jgi:hydroxymethylpyrimidine/phosphomethylpyrimidine kinase
MLETVRVIYVPRLLSIAGSDPSGGAGVQGDLKTFAAFGGYGMAVITALTAQNTQGVSGVWPVSAEIVAAQITPVIDDLDPDAIKIGMVATAANARAIAGALSNLTCPVVLDPVLIPTQGVSLAETGLEAALTGDLLSLASLVTPNIFEAAALTAMGPASSTAEMVAQGRALLARGARAVLVKGGDLAGAPIDVLVTGDETRLFHGRRVVTRHTHGTGCALSAAITAELAKGRPLIDAIATAKSWLENALESADDLAGALGVSAGRGPPHHFFSRRSGLAPGDLA